MKKYTVPFRLADVITLISVLALDEYTFRTEKNLTDAIRANSQSASSWFEIVEAHPEFFRFNATKDKVALRLRYYMPEGEDAKRPPFSIAETQTIIESAITLQEKEIEFNQRNSHRTPIIVALFTLLGVIGSAVLNLNASNKLSQKIDTLTQKIDSIPAKLQTTQYHP